MVHGRVGRVDLHDGLRRIRTAGGTSLDRREALQGSIADIVVRNWGALIALVGLMLIYGGFNRAVRPLVLMVAGASKPIFIALVLSHGSRYLGYQAGIAVAIDAFWVVLFAWYLLAARRERT